MEQVKKQRYREIDIAKGIAIILVVLGHCVIDTNGKVPLGIPSITAQVIYSIHLSLFFFLSGLLSNKIIEHKKINGKYILKRFKRLIIPYFVCGLVFVVMQIAQSKMIGEHYSFSSLWKIVIGINPYYNLWFLFVLFILSLIGALIARKNTILIIVIVSLVLSIVAGMYVVEGSNILNIPLKILKYSFFYYLGMYCGIQYEKNKKALKLKVGLVAVVVFVLGSVFSLQLNDGIIKSVLGTIISLAGIIIALVISNLICKIKASKAIECFGINCMGIFVISGFILPIIQTLLKNRLNIGYYFITIIYFVLTLFLSLLVSILLKKIKILKLLVLGEE